MTNDNSPARENEPDLVVPVLREEVHVGAVAVETGGVRVTKRVEGHEQLLEQELRTGRVEVKRVKTNRVVDGPQTAQRTGNTLVIPVVSEILRVTKEWVVTEEIHVTQVEERTTVQERVLVSHEVAEVQRFDSKGRIIDEIPERSSTIAQAPHFTEKASDANARRILADPPSLLKNRSDQQNQ